MHLLLAAQDTLAPGDTFATKLRNLESCGYQAVELVYRSVKGNETEVKAALDGSRIVAPTMCCSAEHDLAAPGVDRGERIGYFKQSLDLAREFGVRAFISVPVRGSLPPGTTEAQELGLYVDALAQVGEHAAALGMVVVIEPLIRYETHLINRVEQAVAVAQRVSSPGVKVMADFFHMNVEEADMAASVKAAADWIAHVHLADSNRLNPGRGHTDFGPALRALQECGYQGAISLECRLAGDPLAELKHSAAHIKSLLL